MSSATKMPLDDGEQGSWTSHSQISKPEKCKGKPLLVGLIVFTSVFFLIVMTFNFLSSSPLAKGIFLNTTGDVSDLYYLEITPAGWTFSIWGFIYTWQILWLIYVFAGIFRKNSNREYIYIGPETETPFFYFLYIFNLACNLSWIFMFDRQYVGWSLVPIALLPFSLYVCLVISHVRLMQNGSYMMKIGMCKDLWMKRFLIQNGLAFYATWVTIATLLNFAIMLTYRLGVNQSTACTVSLSILSVEICIWGVLDIFVFERYTRYLFSPYIVVNFALIGSLSKNYKAGATNSIFTLVLLCVAACVAVVKVVMLFYRHKTRPLFSNNVSEANKVEMA